MLCHGIHNGGTPVLAVVVCMLRFFIKVMHSLQTDVHDALAEEWSAKNAFRHPRSEMASMRHWYGGNLLNSASTAHAQLIEWYFYFDLLLF